MPVTSAVQFVRLSDIGPGLRAPLTALAVAAVLTAGPLTGGRPALAQGAPVTGTGILGADMSGASSVSGSYGGGSVGYSGSYGGGNYGVGTTGQVMRADGGGYSYRNDGPANAPTLYDYGGAGAYGASGGYATGAAATGGGNGAPVTNSRILGTTLAESDPAPRRRETGDDPSFLMVGLGAYDINDDKTAAELDIAYRSDYKLWIFKPHAGAMVTHTGALYGWGGILFDLYLGNRFVATPSTAIGAYYEGDGKDLGHWLEFRSGLDLAYRFDDRSRLGVGYYHISNASIGSDNPGTESLFLHYDIPMTKLFPR